MSKRVNELYLFDILIAILKIENVSNRYSDAEDLKYDFMSWDTVIREFEIVGEATNILIKNNILDDDSRVVVDFRNLLIHHYFGIDAHEVWDVIHNDLKEFLLLILKKIGFIDKEIYMELIDDLSDEVKHINFIYDYLQGMK